LAVVNLDRVTAVLRPREPWEAADLGARLTRREAATIYLAWFGVTLPVLLISVLLTIFTDSYFLAVLLYWWLEPVADGPMLHVLSRRLFGENVSAWAAIKQTLPLAWRNRIFLLPPMRFHFARSVAMPITQLEGLSGAARRNRAAVINSRIFRYGMGLTTVYEHLATAIYAGIAIFALIMVPPQMQDSMGVWWFDALGAGGSVGTNLLSLFLLYVAQTALQPWFVGAGFGLYINCRTRLEAWDLEVAFRRMVERRQKRKGVLAAVAVVLLVTVPLANFHDAVADEPVVVTGAEQAFNDFWTEEQISAGLLALEKDPRFNVSVTTKEWVRITPPDPEDETGAEPESARMTALFELLEALGVFFAVLVEFALWIAVAAVLILFFYLRKYWLPFLQPAKKSATGPRRVLLADGEITRESLPEDLPGEVLRLWGAGHKREALALLYRGAVFAAVVQQGVSLPDSATEDDCIRAVTAQTAPDSAAFFRRLAVAWLRSAYGAQFPGEDEVSAMCNEWPAVYGAAS
jgi:hypothetical protein